MHRSADRLMLVALATVTSTATAAAQSAAGLGALTTQLHREMLIEHRMDRFAAIAADSYVVMIPNGARETKAQDISGASNFHVDSVTFSNVSVRAFGTSAVVTGQWGIIGKLGTFDMTGDYEFMSFYAYTGGKWVLVAESVTRKRASMAAALSGM